MDNDVHAQYFTLLHYSNSSLRSWTRLSLPDSLFLASLVEGYKTVTDAYGVELSSPYKGGANGVFVSACGVSFHEQAYPTGTVDFGMSFTAMHWLSSAPQGLVGRDELQAANCAASDSNCGSAEREQGASDFNKIITARAKELKKGGRMVIVNFSKSAEGHYLGKVRTIRTDELFAPFIAEKFVCT